MAAVAHTIVYPVAPVSFAMGMLSAMLHETKLLGRFARCRSLSARLIDKAPHYGRCIDGYDFVSDRTPAMRRHYRAVRKAGR